MGATLSTLSSIGMAVLPPAVYIDQFVSIMRKHDSTGFSKDVPGVLIFANITRCFFWLSKRFEIALLIQSLLMIAAQLALLFVVVKYAYRADDAAGPRSEALEGSKTAQQRLLGTLQEKEPLAQRPLLFWQWPLYGTYLEWIAGFVFVLGILYLVLRGFAWFVEGIGYFALGLESTLPIPQLLTNWRRKSLSGFRWTVLGGWVAGDAFKTIYFFVKEDNALQFRVCAIFQLSIDCLIVGQAVLYRHNTRLEDSALSEEQEEAAYQAAQRA